MMHLAAGEGNEPVVPFGNEDYYTGLLSAVGTLLALIHRERTGVSQYVEVSQLLATVFVVSEFYRTGGDLRSTQRRAVDHREGMHETGAVYLGSVVAASQRSFWHLFRHA